MASLPVHQNDASPVPLLLLFINNSGMGPNFTVAEVSSKWMTHTQADLHK